LRIQMEEEEDDDEVEEEEKEDDEDEKGEDKAATANPSFFTFPVDYPQALLERDENNDEHFDTNGIDSSNVFEMADGIADSTLVEV